MKKLRVKMNKKLFLLGLFLLAFTANLFASVYKDVCIERGGDNPDEYPNSDWTTNCVYVCNLNEYPVILQYEYKLNSRDAAWQRSKEHTVEPYKEVSTFEYENLDTRIPYGYKNFTLLDCFDGEIKALRIVYVKIDHTERNKKRSEDIQKFLFGN